MHILHGTWLPSDGVFALWGEDSARLSHTLNADRLLKHAVALTPDIAPNGHAFELMLPTVTDGSDQHFLPSPEARDAGLIVPEGSPRPRPWSIYALTLPPTDAFDLLLAMRRPDLPFTPGTDLRFWRQAVPLAARCLAEGAFLPVLEREGKLIRASWQAMLQPGELDQLATRMPSACRAFAKHDHAPDVLLRHFLNSAVDAFIRRTAIKMPRRFGPDAPAVLSALTEPGNVLRSPSAHRLYQAWQQWQEPLASLKPAQSEFRIGFRLEAPEQDGQGWWLSYLLQAEDDPSLLIDADAVWNATGSTLIYLERRFDSAQDKLLRALGEAASLFPPIEASLHGSRPVGAPLSPEEAFQFLSEAGGALEAAGFAVLIPNWWRKEARLRAKMKVKAAEAGRASGLLSRDRLLNYEWQVSLGDQPISRAEFEELVALKQPIVRFRGEWVALDPAQIEAALKFMRRPQTGEIGLLEALRLTADPEAVAAQGADGVQAGAAEAVEVEFEGRLSEALARLHMPERAATPPIPGGLQATLRPYQVRGFGWLTEMRRLGLGACLADDMGLGKTIQQITLWLHEREQLGVNRPALLICPTSVVGNWRHELGRFAPSLRVLAHHGTARQSSESFSDLARQHDVVLTSYALLRRDLPLLQTVEWASVTLDEAQNIKNSQTQAAQAARALGANFRLALTGTPVENRLTELWSIMHFLNPGYLGSRKQFTERFAGPIEREQNKQAAERLRRLIGPFVLRRLKTDRAIISDLPDKFENKVYCTLTPEQATLYQSVVDEAMEAVESAESEMERRGNVLRLLTRLKQVCNHPAHFLKETGAESGGRTAIKERSGKLTRLTEMLEEAAENDDAALIFTQYAEMGGMLQRYLSAHLDSPVLFLHGGTPAAMRDEMVSQFQTADGSRVFVLSLRAGGTGLNLTRANHVFHYDRWYNPAVENQATDRAFRIGQTRAVQVHKFICLGTLEERLDELIEQKRALAEQIVGEGESWLSELSDAELHDLVRLRVDEAAPASD